MNSEDKLIESLETRVDGWKRNDGRKAWVNTPLSELRASLSELSRRASRIEELEKALRPFAKAFDVGERGRSDSRRKWRDEMPGDWPTTIVVTMQNGRDARQALSDHPDKEGGK